MQSRGRTPARRVGHKHETPHSLAADFLFVAGKHWKVLVLLMVHAGMVGMVVCGGDRERDVQSTAAVLNEIGVGGLSVEVATDNEAALKSLVERGLAASSARGYHWRNISEARLQAKGIERAVCIMKEGIYANWLALERHCNARIALESPLLGYLVGHVYRTYNAYCEGKAGSTPLERLREKRGGPKKWSSPVSPCAPSCFPLLDGVSAFPRVLSPFVSHCPLYPFLFPFVGWCVRLSEGLVPEGLVSLCFPLCPLMFPLVGWCVHLAEGLVSHCLPLCPFLSLLVALPMVLSPFVSHCTPSCFPLLDGASALHIISFLVLRTVYCTMGFLTQSQGVRIGLVSLCLPPNVSLRVSFLLVGMSTAPVPCLHFSPIVSSPHVCLCWMIAFLMSCLSLVSQCFPLPSHMCVCVGWCVRLPYVLSLIVSPHVCLCWMACPPSQGLVFPSHPFCPIERARRVVFPFCFPVSPHMCACDGMSDSLASPLSAIVSHCLPICMPVCPPSRGLVSPCLPTICICVGWCVRLPKVLSPWCVRLLEVLAPTVSHGLLKWCVRLPDILFPNCLPLSTHVCLCWMVCPPSRGLVSPRLPSCLSLSPVVSTCFPLSPIVSRCFPLSPHMCLYWMVHLPEVLFFIVSHCLLRYVCLCWMVCPPS